MDIKSAFKSLDEQYKKLEPEFSKYITDKKIDLIERWDFFVNAPSVLKVKNYSLDAIDNKFFNAMKVYWSFEGHDIYLDDEINVIKLFNGFIKESQINAEGFFDESISTNDIEQAIEFVLTLKLESVVFDLEFMGG